MNHDSTSPFTISTSRRKLLIGGAAARRCDVPVGPGLRRDRTRRNSWRKASP